MLKEFLEAYLHIIGSDKNIFRENYLCFVKVEIHITATFHSWTFSNCAVALRLPPPPKKKKPNAKLPFKELQDKVAFL